MCFRIFTGLLIFSLLPVLLAVNVYMWHRHGINHSMILSFDAREKVRGQWHMLLEAGSGAMALWGVTVAAAAYTPGLSATALGWLPLVLFIALLLILILQPLRSARSGRLPWLAVVLGRMLLAVSEPSLSRA